MFFISSKVVWWSIVEMLFLLLCVMVSKSVMNTSATITLLIVEGLFSLFLLVGLMVDSSVLITLFVCGKMGILPFWFWVFKVFSGASVEFLWLVMSWYKIVPILLFLQTQDQTVIWLCALNCAISFMLGRSMMSSRELYSCLCIFSSGWLLYSCVLGNMLVVMLSIYIVMLWSLLFSSKETWSLSAFVFYIGFPPTAAFFVKMLLMSGAVYLSAMVPFLMMVALVFMTLLLTMTHSSKNSVFICLLVIMNVLLL